MVINLSSFINFFISKWKYFLFVLLTMFVQYFLFPIEFKKFDLKFDNYYSLYFCYTVYFTFDFGFQRNLVRTRENIFIPYFLYTFFGYIFILYSLNFAFYEILIASLFSSISHSLSFYKYIYEYLERPIFSVFIRFYHTLTLFLSFYFGWDERSFFVFYCISHFLLIFYFLFFENDKLDLKKIIFTRSQVYFLLVNIIFLLGNVYDKYLVGEAVLKNNVFIIVNESATYTLSMVNILFPLIVFNSSMTYVDKHLFFKRFFLFSLLIFLFVLYFLTYQFGLDNIKYDALIFIYAFAILLNSSNSYLTITPKSTSLLMYFIASVLPTLLYFFYILYFNITFQLFLFAQIVKLFTEFFLRNLILKHIDL